jgi:hypothetical protein
MTLKQNTVYSFTVPIGESLDAVRKILSVLDQPEEYKQLFDKPKDSHKIKTAQTGRYIEIIFEAPGDPEADRVINDLLKKYESKTRPIFPVEDNLRYEPPKEKNSRTYRGG